MFDHDRKKLAIVTKPEVRDDRAMATPRRKHRVATVLVDGMTAFEPAISSEFFAMDRGPELGVDWYRHVFCTEVPGRLTVRGAPDIFVDLDLSELRRADTIVIPGWNATKDPPSPALAAALVAAHGRGARLITFCTGAFALAATGLLDGRRATTHWCHSELFAERFPNVAFDPSVLFVDDGDILTAAGSASCIDLALYVVRQDYGAEIANLVARDLVVPPHRDGGQAQYIPAPVAECAESDPLNETIDWALANLGGAPHAAAPGGPRHDEQPHVLASLRRGHRHHAAPLDRAPADRRGTGAARDHLAPDRADRRAVRLRFGGLAARAVPTDGALLAAGVSSGVRTAGLKNTHRPGRREAKGDHMKIRIGVGLGVGNTLGSPAELGEVVDLLEDLAFDSLWMSDRVTGPALDPLMALAFAAGRTSRLKLGTNVSVLPGRDPFLMARQMAAVDQLSGGRLLPAVGLGSPSRADRPPFGVTKGTRARVFEEGLAIMRALWAEGGSVAHPDPAGKASVIDPKPTRPLEVWFGGRSTPALQRAGRLSDGWIGSFQSPAETGAARQVIIDAATEAGREIDDDHYGTAIFYARTQRSELAEMVVQALSQDYVPEVLLPCGEHQLCEVVADYVQHGLTKFVLVPADRPADWADELGWLRRITAPLEN